jgi:integrase
MKKNTSVIASSKNVTLRKRKLRSGNGYTLTIDTHIDGKRKEEYLGLILTGNKNTDAETLALARKIHAKRVLELQSEQHGEIDRSKLSADFVAFFMQCVEEKKRAKRWANTLYHLKNYTQGRTVQFRHVNAAWVEAFQEYLRPLVAHNTRVHYVETVKTALNIAVKKKILAVNPCVYATLEHAKEVRKTYLTLEEIRTLQEAECDASEVKRAFMFACFTGLRISDVRALLWGQIQDATMLYRQEKTDTQEYQPISDEALRWLHAVPRGQSNEAVFGLLSEQHLNKHLHRWVRRSGIEKHVTFHTARHTFATLAISSDVDLYTLQKLMGHSEIRSTQIYAKVIDKKKEEAVKKLPTL